jgi:hypothetical protein
VVHIFRWFCAALLLVFGAVACSKEGVAIQPAPTLTPTAAPANDSDAEREPPTAGEEGEADDVAEASASPSSVPGSAGLFAEANRVLETMTASSYSHHTHASGAVYEVDCSGFIDLLLARVEPPALAELRAATVRRPLAKHFVQFFSAGSQSQRFQRLTQIQQLLPGDIIAWNKPADVTSTNTGHVMLVSAPAEQRAEQLWAIAIIDSTAAPHGPSDARKRAHITGVGRGFIVLESDATGAPVAYHWTRARSSPRHTTKIALGRLL